MIKCFKQYLQYITKKTEALNKITSESWDGWIDVTACPPSEFIKGKRQAEYFICAILIPNYGGTYSRGCKIIVYDWYAKKWVYDGGIVTHWRCCPKPPKEGKQ